MDKEYVILYTHQKQKKAKTWHDGTLRLASLGNKAVLYDDKGSKLDSIYVKAGGITEGEQLESDRYYIQVEELKSTSPAIKNESQSASSVGVCEYQRSVPSSQTRCAGLKRKKSGFVPPKMFKQARCDPVDTELKPSYYNELGEAVGFGQLTYDVSQNTRPLSRTDTPHRNDVLKIYSNYGQANSQFSQTSSQESEDDLASLTSQHRVQNITGNPGAQLFNGKQNQSPAIVSGGQNSEVRSPWSVYGSNSNSPSLSTSNVVTNSKTHSDASDYKNNMIRQQETTYDISRQHFTNKQHEDENSCLRNNFNTPFPAGQEISDLDLSTPEFETKYIGNNSASKNVFEKYSTVTNSADGKGNNVSKQKRNVNEIMNLLRGRSNITRGYNDKEKQHTNSSMHAQDRWNESLENLECTGDPKVMKSVSVNKNDDCQESLLENETSRFQIPLGRKHIVTESEIFCDFEENFNENNYREVFKTICQSNSHQENVSKVPTALTNCQVTNLKLTDPQDVCEKIPKSLAKLEFSDDETNGPQACFAISYSPLSHVTDSDEDDLDIGTAEQESQWNANSVQTNSEEVPVITASEQQPNNSEFSNFDYGNETCKLSDDEVGHMSKTDGNADDVNREEKNVCVSEVHSPIAVKSKSFNIQEDNVAGAYTNESEGDMVVIGLDKCSKNENDCVDNYNDTTLCTSNKPSGSQRTEQITLHMEQDKNKCIPELSGSTSNDETQTAVTCGKTSDILFQMEDTHVSSAAGRPECKGDCVQINNKETCQKIIVSGEDSYEEANSMENDEILNLLDVQISDMNRKKKINTAIISKQEIKCDHHQNQFANTSNENVTDILDSINEDYEDEATTNMTANIKCETKNNLGDNVELPNSESTACKTTQSQDTMDFSCDTFVGDSQQFYADQPPVADYFEWEQKHSIDTESECSLGDVFIKKSTIDTDRNSLNSVASQKYNEVPVSLVHTKTNENQRNICSTFENVNADNQQFQNIQVHNIHSMGSLDEIFSTSQTIPSLQADNPHEAVVNQEDPFQRLPDLPVDPAPHPSKLFGRGVRNRLRRIAVADAGISDDEKLDSQIMPSGRLCHTVNSGQDGYRMLGGVCSSAVRDVRGNATCDGSQREDNIKRTRPMAPCFTVPQLSDSDGGVSVGASPSFYVDWCGDKPQFLQNSSDKQMAAPSPDCFVPDLPTLVWPRSGYQSPLDSCGSDSPGLPLAHPSTVPTIPDINKDEDDEIYNQLYKARLLYPRPAPPSDKGTSCGIDNIDSPVDVAIRDCMDLDVSSPDSFHYSKPKTSSSLQTFRHRQKTVMKSKPFDDEVTHSSYQTYRFSPRKTPHNEAYVSPSVHDFDQVKVPAESCREVDSQSQDVFMNDSPSILDRNNKPVDSCTGYYNHMTGLHKEAVNSTRRLMTWNVDSPPIFDSDPQFSDENVEFEMGNAKPSLVKQVGERNSQPVGNTDSKWGKYIPDSSPEDMDITAFTQKQAARVTDFSVIESPVPQLRTVTNESLHIGQAGSENPNGDAVKTNVCLSSYKPKSPSQEIQNSFSSTDSFEEMVANHVFSGETALTPNCNSNLPQSNTSAQDHEQQNDLVNGQGESVNNKILVLGQRNTIQQVETKEQEPDRNADNKSEIDKAPQKQLVSSCPINKQMSGSCETETIAETGSVNQPLKDEVAKCEDTAKVCDQDGIVCSGHSEQLTEKGEVLENGKLILSLESKHPSPGVSQNSVVYINSQEPSANWHDRNTTNELCMSSTSSADRTWMNNASGLVSPVVTRTSVNHSQDNFMGYDSDDEFQILNNISRSSVAISANKLSKSQLTIEKNKSKCQLASPKVSPNICSKFSGDNNTPGVNSQTTRYKSHANARFRSPLQSPDVSQATTSASPGVTSPATCARKAFKPPATFSWSPVSSPRVGELTRHSRTQAEHQNSRQLTSGNKETKSAYQPVSSAASKDVVRKGFRPPTHVQTPLQTPSVTNCARPLPPPSQQRTHTGATAQSVFSGELRFPSQSEIDRCPTPLRQASISVTFSSVLEYKQALTAALREYMNLQLFDVAKRYHHALAQVDYSGYSTVGSEKSGSSSSSPNPACQCGAPSKMVCVRKEGPNNGRFFYTCNAARHQQCKFFQWADEKSSGGHTGGSKQKISEPQALNSYMNTQRVHCYCQCQLVKRSKENITPFFKAPKWARSRGEGPLLQKKQIFLRLPYKGHSSLYAKDDLWVVSQHLDFDPGSTFIARSVYYGPTSASEVEIEPLVGYSPSNWQNEAVCHALLAGNASSELTCLENIREHIQAQFPPVVPHLLHRDDDGLVTSSNSRGFQAPRSVCGTSASRNIHLQSAQLDEVVGEYISRYQLNDDQSEALRRVANMFSMEKSDHVDSVLLIHGVFGAGKSFLLSVIVLFLVQVFQMNNQASPGQPFPWKLLISSTTNVAVDRILMGLLQLGFEDFVRVGSVKKIAKPVLPFSVHASGTDSQELRDLQEMLRSGELTAAEKHHVRQSIEKHRQGENKRRLGRVRVVGVTCASCSLACLNGIQFPLVMLDECSQMTEPASLLPIARFGCQKLLLVGDPKQLDPTIQGADAAHSTGLEQTMFDRLVKMGYVPTLLRTQYRCHPGISSAANHLFYGGILVDGITDTDRPPVLADLPTVCFYDVARGRECCERAGSYYNDDEAKFVVFLIDTLVACDVQPAAIGVITLYRSQMARINDLLTGLGGDDQEARGVQVSTVDAFQGGERDVVILSCVRTQACGFIDNDKRTNVALTRARNHLLIVGNRYNLAANLLWGKVIRHCQGFPNGIQSADEAKDKLEHCRTSMKLSRSSDITGTNSAENQNSPNVTQRSKGRKGKTKKRKSTPSMELASDQEGITNIQNMKPKKRKRPQNVRTLSNLDENVDFVDDNNTKCNSKIQKRAVNTATKQKYNPLAALTEQRNSHLSRDSNEKVTSDNGHKTDYTSYTEMDDSLPMSLSSSSDGQNTNIFSPHLQIHNDSGECDFGTLHNGSPEKSSTAQKRAGKTHTKPRLSDRLKLDMFETTEPIVSDDDLPAFDL